MRISDWSSDVCSSDLIIGTRHGEKLYETLLTVEEMHKAQDLGDYFKVSPDDRDLNYDKYFEEGEPQFMNGEEYNSHNTERLSIEGMKNMVIKLRSEEHKSELQSLMRISYAVYCLKQKKKK